MTPETCTCREAMNLRPAVAGPPGPTAYDATRRGHAHGIPAVPFTIDDEKGNPLDLASLRDRPLHTVVSLDDGTDKPEIRIFTDQESSVSALRELSSAHTDVKEEGLSVAAAARSRLGVDLDLTIWEHIDLTGCGWEFHTDTDISVLTNFDNAWACGFLWWGWKQLGTNASSFMVAIGWPYFGFWDRGGNSIGWALHPPSGLSTLWSGYVSNLVHFGWNDRAISIRLPGATFP